MILNLLRITILFVMRQRLLSEGAKELSYEIRGIVKKAQQVQALGRKIYWENIGDPIQKHASIPQWMKEIIIDLLKKDESYGYCDSKGILKTRKFLAEKTNKQGGVRITPDDILFFNGLGDAIAKVYQYIVPTSRIIGPSPSYSTHSSAEASHANHHPITYQLNPENNWYPDVEDLYLKVKYNPNIVGILIINPDNPTGMVYPLEILEKIVQIAKEFNLFLIADEIYLHITYNGVRAHSLAEVIGDLPGISMKGISKEFPWPGARCGWTEFYNRDKSKEFNKYCAALENAKMIEVCSTRLPQMAIPQIMSDTRYVEYQEKRNRAIGKRSSHIARLLADIPTLTFNTTNGAFYNTIIFKQGTLKPSQRLKIKDKKIQELLDTWLQEEPHMALDKRFVYYLLAAKGVCVVPISSFCSDLQGFRVTLLEEDEEHLIQIFTKIKEAVLEYTEVNETVV